MHNESSHFRTAISQSGMPAGLTSSANLMASKAKAKAKSVVSDGFASLLG